MDATLRQLNVPSAIKNPAFWRAFDTLPRNQQDHISAWVKFRLRIILEEHQASPAIEQSSRRLEVWQEYSHLNRAVSQNAVIRDIAAHSDVHHVEVQYGSEQGGGDIGFRVLIVLRERKEIANTDLQRVIPKTVELDLSNGDKIILATSVMDFDTYEERSNALPGSRDLRPLNELPIESL